MDALMISCPSCHHKFEPGSAFMKDYEVQARQKMATEWHKMKLEVEKDKQAIEQQKQQLLKQQQQQEHELEQRLVLERQKLQQQLQESIRKSVASDFENQLK